jgi:MFS family permease
MKTTTDQAPTRLTVSPLLLTIFAVTLMAVLGVASIAPALPGVAAHFQVSAAQVALLITAFTLPGVILTPMMGLLADRWGRKAVLVPALCVFGIAGVACATANSLQTLVLLRLLQGVGGAPLGALNVTIIGDAFRGHRQIATMGVNSAVLSIGTGIYPLLGGMLADADWRFPFVLPVVALPIAWLAARTVPDHESPAGQGFGSYFRRLRESLNRHLLALMAVSLLTFVMLYGSFLTYMPFLLHERFGSSSTVIGLVISSASIASGLAALWLAPLTRRFGQRQLILASVVLYVLSVGLAPFLPGVWWLLLPALLFGAGNGLNVPTVQSWIAREVERDVRAGVMSLNAMMLRGGQTLGPVLASAGYAIAGLEGAFAVGVLSALGLGAIVAGMRR